MTVQHPVAHHTDPDGERTRPITRNPVINHCEGGGPDDGHQQSVGPGVICEIEWREPCVAGIDPHSLPSEQQEPGPEQIEKQRRSEQ